MSYSTSKPAIPLSSAMFDHCSFVSFSNHRLTLSYVLKPGVDINAVTTRLASFCSKYKNGQINGVSVQGTASNYNANTKQWTQQYAFEGVPEQTGIGMLRHDFTAGDAGSFVSALLSNGMASHGALAAVHNATRAGGAVQGRR